MREIKLNTLTHELLLKHFQLEKGKPDISLGLRATVGMSVPIVLGLLTGSLVNGIQAALAVFLTILTDVGGAYRHRAIAMFTAIVGVTLATLLASQVAGISWLAVVLTFFCCFVSGLANLYGNTANLVGFVTTLTFVTAIFTPTTLSTALQRCELTLAGGIWAMVLSLGLWVLHPYQPVLEAVAESYLRLTRFIQLATYKLHLAKYSQKWSENFAQAYDVVIDRLKTARLVWAGVRMGRQGASRRGVQLLILLEDLGRITNAVVALTEILEIASSNPIFAQVHWEVELVMQEVALVVAQISTTSKKGGGEISCKELAQSIEALEAKLEVLKSQSIHEVDEYYGLVNIRKVMNSLQQLVKQVYTDAEIAKQLGGSTPPLSQPDTNEWMEESPSVVQTLKDNLTFQSTGLRHALRLGLTTAIAVLLAYSLHLLRGYWVPLSVLVILKPNFGGTFQRAVQRIGGTILGGVVAIALTSMIQNAWILLLFLALLVFVAFAVKPLNYGVFVIVVTPLILVLVHITNTGDWRLSIWRILNTVIGGGLALVGGYLLFPSWERCRLPAQLAQTIRANLAYFQRVIAAYDTVAQNPRTINAARRQTELQNANTAAAIQRLLSEPSRLRGEVEAVMALVLYTRSFSNTVTTLSEHLREFTGNRKLPDINSFTEAIAVTLTNQADFLEHTTLLQPLPDLDALLEPIHMHVQQLHTIRIAERAINSSGITPTLLVIREHTLVSIELDRIAATITTMHGAVDRLQS
ncbi:MAG: FUSC family protein [Rhizonema sp. NSF051]|nr:FUSC family protein [Rhizonema sp. NSF051]